MICAGNNPSLDKFAQRAQATRHDQRTPVPPKLAGLDPMLRILTHDSYAPAREAAAQGLGYLGSAKAAPVLAKALSDPDKHVRRRAAAALETIPADAVAEQLADAAKNDKEAIVRSYAVRALGSIEPTPHVISALARATEDTAAEVRQNAADELGQLKVSEGLEPLVKLFNDPDEDVRWAAVRAVGDLQDRRATPYLVNALKDDVPQVSNAAERGLQKLGIGKRKGLGFDRETIADE
jgi:HEAT repeat protein